MQRANIACLFYPWIDWLERDDDRLSLPVCKTPEETIEHLKSIRRMSRATLNSRLNSNLCPRPCAKINYEFSHIVQSDFYPKDHKKENRSIITLNYQDVRTRLGNERLLYDFNDIVAAIGGSLGLFLGFSCLNAACWITERVTQFLSKLC